MFKLNYYLQKSNSSTISSISVDESYNPKSAGIIYTDIVGFERKVESICSVCIHLQTRDPDDENALAKMARNKTHKEQSRVKNTLKNQFIN